MDPIQLKGTLRTRHPFLFGFPASAARTKAKTSSAARDRRSLQDDYICCYEVNRPAAQRKKRKQLRYC